MKNVIKKNKEREDEIKSKKKWTKQETGRKNKESELKRKQRQLNVKELENAKEN